MRHDRSCLRIKSAPWRHYERFDIIYVYFIQEILNEKYNLILFIYPPNTIQYNKVVKL